MTNPLDTCCCIYLALGASLLVWTLGLGFTVKHVLRLTEIVYTYDMIVPAYSALFYVGSVSMRAAGCIVNDLWDQDIDKQVDRTKTRPLASGEVTQNQALAFLVPHCVAGLGVLAFLNWQAIALSFAITPVAALYPLAKRYTNYPQFVLGKLNKRGSQTF